MVNFMGIAAGIGESIAASVKEEQKRIDLLTDRALDYHTREYYRLKERRREKVDNTEAIIGELAAKFGDDENALRRAAFYVNQHGIQGTKALMNDFDKERATNNTISAVDFFKYVPADKDVPLRTKREYAQGIVAPVQLGEPEFLTGVKSDRGIASLFTGDPKEALQRGFEERKAMGLYGKETERPDLQFGTGGVDRSLLLGAPKTDAQRLAFSKQRLDIFKARNTPEDIAKSDVLQKELSTLETNVSNLEDNAIRANIKQKVPQSASGLMTTGNLLMSMSTPGSADYQRGSKMYELGREQKTKEEEIESTNTGGRLTQGYVTSEWNRDVKRLDGYFGRSVIGGEEQFIFGSKDKYLAAKEKLYRDTTSRWKGRLDKRAEAAWADIGLKNNISAKPKEEDKSKSGMPESKQPIITQEKKEVKTKGKGPTPILDAIDSKGEKVVRAYLKRDRNMTDKQIDALIEREKKLKKGKTSVKKQPEVTQTSNVTDEELYGLTQERPFFATPVKDMFKTTGTGRKLTGREKLFRKSKGGLMGRN
tara:strand:- start:3562 stop:5172 length:1611 start_codon:yes stop_codon:yes gene_type:complete